MYGLSWIVLAVLIILFKVWNKTYNASTGLPGVKIMFLWFEPFISFLGSQVFTFSQKISVNFQLLLRFIQGLSFLVALAGLVIAVVLTDLSISDVFASILAFVPTGWGILSVSYLCLLSLFSFSYIYAPPCQVRKSCVFDRIRIPKLCLTVVYSSCI